MAGLGALLGKTGGNDSADSNNNDARNDTDNASATAGNASEQPHETDEDSVNRAADATTTDDSGDRKALLIATSAPIQRFKIGRFQFEHATLYLYEQQDVDDFRKLVKGLPPVDRNQIKVIDEEAAKNMVRPIEPGATKQFDSSVGRQREVGPTGEKVIGDDPLDAGVGGQGEQFTKRAQEDNNAPVAGTEPKHVVNEQNRGDVDKTAEERAAQDAKDQSENGVQ